MLPRILVESEHYNIYNIHYVLSNLTLIIFIYLIIRSRIKRVTTHLSYNYNINLKVQLCSFDTLSVKLLEILRFLLIHSGKFINSILLGANTVMMSINIKHSLRYFCV